MNLDHLKNLSIDQTSADEADILDGDGNQVAVCATYFEEQTGDWCGTEKMLANARLFAASYRLLEACESEVKWYEELIAMSTTFGADALASAHAQRIDRIRAVIAAAKGPQTPKET